MSTKYTSVDVFYKHLFVSELLPTELTLHALVSYAKERADLGHFKVERNGNLVTLTTEKQVDFNGFKVSLSTKDGQSFGVVWYESTKVENKIFSVGDDVTISGLMSYGVNRTGQKGRVCPVWQGKFVEGMKKPFLEYLRRELGIDVADVHVTRLPNACRDNKVQLNNLVTVIVSGKVVDAGAVSSLNYRAVAQRKSYGLGSLQCV